MRAATNDHSDVVDRLRDRFPAVAPELIRERVEASFAALAAAPIQSYAPILVLRDVRRQLLDPTTAR